VNIIFLVTIFLTIMDKKSKLNKFDAEMTQLNENKIIELKLSY